MNKEEADRQIEQMVQFIRQEANEKAEEIRIKTEQEFNISKLEFIEQARVQLREEYRLKEQRALTEKRIERSSHINAARLSKIQRKNEVVERIREEARAKLAEAAKHSKYPELLTALIVQGLIRFKETEVTVRVRKEDEQLVRSLLPVAEKLYHDTMLRDTSLDIAVKLKLDEQFLPPASKGRGCSGGVVLTCNRGRTVLDNTLDRRLDLAFEELKPTIRSLAFGGK